MAYIVGTLHADRTAAAMLDFWWLAGDGNCRIDYREMLRGMSLLHDVGPTTVHLLFRIYDAGVWRRLLPLLLL